MKPRTEPGGNSHLDAQEDPPDPAAVEGERRPRMAVEFRILLRRFERTLRDVKERLAAPARDLEKAS